eukprot:CAMPEP_0179418784 /NCGR_PEP_ID=MMETSP0799-20121207/8226_1 /TAXON_ID=46947 /ORGANISM="Geminigera cryophila, Strain CCMP2564" /LENGTH=32 /DNA_ID= /DNA_START= /DNA_END= /DNA_ORIENTATION=
MVGPPPAQEAAAIVFASLSLARHHSRGAAGVE